MFSHTINIEGYTFQGSDGGYTEGDNGNSTDNSNSTSESNSNQESNSFLTNLIAPLLSALNFIKDLLNPATFLSSISSLLTDFFAIFIPSSEDFIFADILDFLKYLNPATTGSPFSKLLDISNGITNILSYLNPSSDNFFLKLAFVPSDERINAISNTVKSKFQFIDSIKTGIDALDQTINNLGNSPRLTMTLGSTQYTEEQRVVVVDLSWYAPFKQYVDLVLTGFIYLFFLWRIFISIPNIINGLGGAIQSDVMITDIQNGFRTGEMKTKGGWFRR